MKIAMRVFRIFGTARTPYLTYDVYTNDSLHGVCFPTVNKIEFISSHMSIMEFMFSFIAFRRNINYLSSKLLIWENQGIKHKKNLPDMVYITSSNTLGIQHPIHVQHIRVSFHILYLETYNIKRNNIYVCDWQAQTGARYLYSFTKFHNNQLTTSNHRLKGRSR